MQPIIIYMTQNDGGPPRTFSLLRQDGTIVDLTNASSVVFDIYKPNTHIQTNSSSNSCNILLPKTNGQVLYNWSTSDLPNAGVSMSKVVVNYNNGGGPETAIVAIQIQEDPAID